MFFSSVHAVTYQSIERGSGEMWHTMYIDFVDGLGHPFPRWQIAWPVRRRAEFQITGYEYETGDAHAVAEFRWRESFHERVSFTKLEAYTQWSFGVKSNPNVHEFPNATVLGHGYHGGHPVTYVWSNLEMHYWHSPYQHLRLFAAKAERTSKGTYVLVEHARANWLDKKHRLKWGKGALRIKRSYTYSGGEFTKGKWGRE